MNLTYFEIILWFYIWAHRERRIHQKLKVSASFFDILVLITVILNSLTSCSVYGFPPLELLLLWRILESFVPEYFLNWNIIWLFGDFFILNKYYESFFLQFGKKVKKGVEMKSTILTNETSPKGNKLLY